VERDWLMRDCSQYCLFQCVLIGIVAYLVAVVSVVCFLVMVALCNRADHYIFALLFLSSIYPFYSSPNLSGRRLDIYHTLTHGVALVRI